jgi:outer membrane protein assembly factor BamB
MAHHGRYGMKRLIAGLMIGAATLTLSVAQDSWSTHRGSNQRTGTTTNAQNRNNAVNFLLAWTLPDMDSVRLPVIVDNDHPTLTTALPPGAWKTPSEAERAVDPYLGNPDTTVPYQYVLCVRQPTDPNEPFPPIARFIWRSGQLPPGYYRIWVYVPSTGTRVGGFRVPYARQAEYTVTDATGTAATLYLNQTLGGWQPLGDRPFYHDGSTEIVVTLNNLIRPASPDYPLSTTPIVAADAIRFAPDYGTVQASPVAIRSPLNTVNRDNHLVYIANGNGTITCVENPIGTPGARVRWTFRVPDLPTQGAGQVYDDEDSNFTAGLFTPNDALGDRYERIYHEIVPTNDASNIQRAYWKIQVPTTGLYYVYAWFPSDDQNARQAQYVIENEGNTLSVRIDQRFGGRWVLLNNLPVEMRSGRTYEISVTNFSPEDVAQGAQRVIADAIRIVSADGLSNAVFSTPAVGKVRVRDGNSTVTRWVVVFGAQNGAVYAIDALGDGENGTRRGETKLYWIVKPANSTGFSYASPLILENENLVAIGNPAGSVYLINTDLDPEDPDTYYRWQYNRFGAAFVSTPAYDPATRLIYIGSSEGGNQFGRLIALNPFRQDNPDTPEDERVAWVYPPEDQDPIEPITSTPAVALGRVYFTTGSLEGGRLYAVKADNGSLVWARPALNAPLTPLFNFFYSSPLVVEQLLYRGISENLVYVGGANARVVAFNADTGELRYISENLGGAIFSSPIFTYVRDTDENGSILGALPAVVVATNSGLLLALHADERINSRRGKLFEGWDLYADTVFASPAVLDNWLYAADDEGIVYAFNVLGVAATEFAEPIVPPPPPQPPQPDAPDYSKLRVSVTTRKEEVDEVLAGRLAPDRLEPRFPDALEWGDTIYVVLWNFKHTPNARPLQIQLIGPGITRVEYTVSPRTTNNPPRDNPNLNWVAVQSITIQSSGNNFYTPGEKYELQVRVGNASWTSDLAWETTQIDRPAPGNGLPGGGLFVPEYGGDDPDSLLTGAGWRFGIANPLGLEGVGVVGAGGTEQNLFNGNNGTLVNTRFRTPQGMIVPVGAGEHGKTLFGDFFARDRRTPQTSNVVPIAINARAYVDDMRWQGGAGAVRRPLPWEVMPTLPNRSPDYPDISGRRIQMLFEGGTDLQRATARLLSTGNRVDVQIEVPRFQPANTEGYTSRTYVFADSNNNGRFDGLESVLQPGVTQNLRIEAYRELTTTATVQPDERLVVEEQTIDFGSLPGGFGFNWGSLFANHPLSAFQPDNPIFQPFWKPFTVRNEGNVNLYPVYLGKARGSPSGTVFLFSDMVSFFAGMPAWTTVASTLDTRFWPQPNPFYPGNNQPYPILQKPQVGDYSPTVLTIPAVPPRRDPNIPVDPRKPQVSVAVPPFQPMGVYSQLIAPYQHNDDGTPGAVNGTFATPPMRVVVRVRETQLTGSTNQGVVPMIDPVPPENAPRISDITPAAFRDPTTGKLHLYWASNRPDPVGRPNSFYLYRSTLNWDGTRTLQNSIRATNGWLPASRNRWWAEPLGPYPNDPNGNLFSTALGLGRPLTNEEIATIKHHRPFVRLTPAGAFLFWTGEVILRNQKYELLFYVPVGTGTGAPLGNPQAVPLDPVAPRSSLSIAGVDGVGNWLFYVAAPSGRSQIFYIASEGDRFASWRREQRLPLSPIVRSVESVSANIYRVSANPTANNTNFVYLADVYFIGTVGDRSESEVLMQRFYVNPRNGNLLTLSDTRADRSLGATQERFLPVVADEVAQKDADQNVWRVRHLDWASIGSGWNSDPTAPDLDIKINGVSILLTRDPENPRQFVLQRPTVDEQTGLLQFEFNQPVLNGGGQVVNLLPRGRIVIDPNNGTIRFVNFAPRLNDLVTVTYRPRVYRLSATAPGSAGTYSQLRTVFQRTMNPRHRLDALGESPVRKGANNGACELNDRPPVDRVWVFFRRTSAPPNSSGNFFFKTLRPGVRLQAPILTQFGRVPVQTGAFTLAQGTNHVVVQLTANNVAGAGLGFYEYDALRGNIYFTTEDLGKEVVVRYLTRDRAGNIVELEERQVVRWIDEGNLARSFATDVEYTSPVPIDLPTNELYLWAMPNVEFRAPGSLFGDIYGGLDESLLLFWSSTRNGVGNIYGGAIQPRFYISPFDPDQD